MSSALFPCIFRHWPADASGNASSLVRAARRGVLVPLWWWWRRPVRYTSPSYVSFPAARSRTESTTSEKKKKRNKRHANDTSQPRQRILKASFYKYASSLSNVVLAVVIAISCHVSARIATHSAPLPTGFTLLSHKSSIHR